MSNDNMTLIVSNLASDNTASWPLTASGGNYSGTSTIGSLSIGSNCSSCGVWHSGIHYCWYPTYWYPQPDKTHMAFKVIKHLMDKKHITLKTVPQFVKLVDEIMELL